MVSSAPHIAILLFADDSAVDARRKRLSTRHNLSRQEQLSQLLTQRATSLAAQSGLPLIRIGTGDQRGQDFGERFVDAISKVFERGYEQVIAIGNDTPDLSLSDISAATQALAQGQSVLGPATDGGIYLVGIDRAHFDKEAWLSLPWQTASLYQSLLWQLRESGLGSVILKKLADLDTLSDYHAYLAGKRLASHLLLILQDLIQLIPQRRELNSAHFQCIDPPVVSSRGPPTCRFSV